MRKFFSLLPCVVFALAVSLHVRAEDPAVVEKPRNQLSDQNVSPIGEKALAIRPAAWLSAETPHFIIHYRRITEAKRVTIEIEFHLNYVAKVLGAGPERYARKSHVFIFEDEKDWKGFLPEAQAPEWSSSFARGDELFLNIRDARTGMFDSQTLAHETTHAIVARLYPGKQWPRWLNEGFAEQMSGQATAARMGQFNTRATQRLQMATLPLDKLIVTDDYPDDPVEVHQYYQSSEKLVRFLMTKNPADRFPKFVDQLLDGTPFPDAIVKIYGDKYKDYPTFTKEYLRLAQ